MLKYITIALALFLAALDYAAYRKILSLKVKRAVRIIFSIVVITANLIPLSVPLFMYFLTNNENGGVMMKISMVILTLFIILTLCRLVLYMFWLPAKSKKWLYSGSIASIFVLIILLYGVFVTRTEYKIKETELQFENLPASFDGYRIAFISDIHVGCMYNSLAELEKLSKKVSSTNADIVLFGGDLVNLHYNELTPEVLEKLAGISGKEPTMAVLGNHDTGYYLKDTIAVPHYLTKDSVEARVNRAGWKMLRDSTIFIYRNGDSIAITGIDYTEEMLKYKHSFKDSDDYNPVPVYKCLDGDVFNITISHLPQLWKTLCNGGYSDLTLSGHIHAMQVKYDILGISFSPSLLLYREWSGLYENENGKLYITDGIGSVGFFARFGANPEITVITLRNINKRGG